MATSTAVPSRDAVRRTAAAAAAAADSSSPSTADASPTDSPRASPSTSSLSSMSSVDNDAADAPTTKSGKLIDTYGNEFQLPDYAMGDIIRAIPKECFKRNTALGLYYVARDMATLATVFYLFHTYVTPATVPSTAARAALWAVYTIIQGLVGTGLWVLAHECGHQAFSPSKIVNDTVGWVCHSMLLVPYFSWKISHGKHHKATGHMEKDMVFMPKTREVYATRISKFVHELDELTEETPIATLLHLVGQQTAGWWMYLLANVTGHDNHEQQKEGRGKGKKNGYTSGVNHFNPASPLFEAKDAKLIVLSDIGIALTISALVWISRNYGVSNMLVWYFIPYMWVNHWLVAITYLQHTDPSLPHYTPSSWTYVRGAAATIDRDFGFIGRHILHGIIETHVLHHYVSTIPFYNADAASEAIKPVMGRHYRADTKGGAIGFLKSMWKSARWCQWVEPSVGAKGEGEGVLFFRNRNGFGVPPAKVEAN